MPDFLKPNPNTPPCGIGIKIYLITLFLISVAIGLFAALKYPMITTDGQGYLKVADNILFNHCVSVSNVESKACVPHWGGNQLPGYPLVIAVVKWFFHQPLPAILILQSILFSLSLLRLIWLINYLFSNLSLTMFSALLLFFSPLTHVWSRYVLTDTIAISITILIFVECLLVYQTKQLRLFRIALLWGVGIFIRNDTVLVLVIVLLSHIKLITSKKNFIHFAFMLCLAAAPVFIWGVRNVSVGISFFPRPPTNGFETDIRSPTGYLRWIKTYYTYEQQLGKSYYPLYLQQYTDILVDVDHEGLIHYKPEVKKLLQELNKFNQQPFPVEIDVEFEKIAQRVIQENYLLYYLGLPSLRGFLLWFNPLDSFGWPFAGLKKDQILEFGIYLKQLLNQERSLQDWVNYQNTANILLYKFFLLFYRGFLLITVSCGLFCWYYLQSKKKIIILLPASRDKSMNNKRLQTPDAAEVNLILKPEQDYFSLILKISLSYFFTRLIFITLIHFPESRYLVEAIPLMEVSAVLILSQLYHRFRASL